MRPRPRWAAGAWILWTCTAAAANPYRLQPEQVAEDTYVLIGALEHFTYENNGNIVNTGFIVTGDGVVVIDTGPSLLYGEAMRAAIAEVTGEPVVQVYITHQHPDHFLGNQAFQDVPIAALPGTVHAIRSIGEDLASNLYYLVGGAMRGTRAVAPTEAVAAGTRRRFGTHELALIGASGHTGADLAVLDLTTGVLFAGDLAFNERAPTTPDADVARWLEALAGLEEQKFDVLVPGHGPIARDATPLVQTAAYLEWLSGRLEAAAAEGLTMPEIMFRQLPERWRDLAVMPEEFRRSVVHLYPEIELEVLRSAPE